MLSPEWHLRDFQAARSAWPGIMGSFSCWFQATAAYCSAGDVRWWAMRGQQWCGFVSRVKRSEMKQTFPQNPISATGCLFWSVSKVRVHLEDSLFKSAAGFKWYIYIYIYILPADLLWTLFCYEDLYLLLTSSFMQRGPLLIYNHHLHMY